MTFDEQDFLNLSQPAHGYSRKFHSLAYSDSWILHVRPLSVISEVSREEGRFDHFLYFVVALWFCISKSGYIVCIRVAASLVTTALSVFFKYDKNSKYERLQQIIACSCQSVYKHLLSGFDSHMDYFYNSWVNVKGMEVLNSILKYGLNICLQDIKY